MTTLHYDLLVVGWGKAGKTLAKTAATQGLKVALVERDRLYAGGTCVNVGCLPTKHLAHLGEVFREAVKLGLTREHENKQAWFNAVASKKEIIAKLNAKNYGLLANQQGIDLYFGTASFTGDKTVDVHTDDGHVSLTADKILINTGSTPRDLKVPGRAGNPFVYHSEAFLNLSQLPKRLMVVGAGFIGLEFASILANFGSHVTLVNRHATLLPNLDRDVAENLEENLVAQGIKIIHNACVTSFTNEMDHTVVTLDIKGKSQQEEVEAVLLALGRVPNTEGLNLDATGIERDQNGAVVVNDKLQTTVPGVWAAGDVKGGPLFTYISYDDFRIIAPQVLGQEGSRTTHNRSVMPTTTFVSPALSHVGASECELEKAGIPYTVKRWASATIPKAHLVNQTRGINKVLIGEDGLVLGATLINAESAEMINFLALAINQKVPASTLKTMLYTHPVFTESLNDNL